MTDKTDSLTRLQRMIADADARAERARALPRAICRWCGGIAKAGEGTRAAAPFSGVGVNVSGDRVFIPPTPSPANADEWRRECAKCAEASMGDLVSAMLGEEVDDRDAHAATARLFWRDANGFEHDEVPWAFVTGHGTGAPFRHVTRDDRERVRQALREVREDRLPALSEWGACGWCGIRTSVGWHEGPPSLTWGDGKRAPLCDACHAVWESKAAPDDMDQQRIAGVIAATGSTAYVWSTVPGSFRLYFETRDADGNGHALAWDYGDGIRDFRSEVWTERPDLAPAELRDEYRARHEVMHAKQDEAARAKREAALLTTW